MFGCRRRSAARGSGRRRGERQREESRMPGRFGSEIGLDLREAVRRRFRLRSSWGSSHVTRRVMNVNQRQVRSPSSGGRSAHAVVRIQGRSVSRFRKSADSWRFEQRVIRRIRGRNRGNENQRIVRPVPTRRQGNGRADPGQGGSDVAAGARGGEGLWHSRSAQRPFAGGGPDSAGAFRPIFPENFGRTFPRKAFVVPCGNVIDPPAVLGLGL